MEEGRCTYCAGLGEVENGPGEAPCPVCRGDGACVACGGDRVVIVGDPGARDRLLDRQETRNRAVDRAELTRQQVRESLLVDEDVEALRGYAEVEELSDEQDDDLLERARTRVERAFAAVKKAVESRAGAAAAATTSDS
jgi:hypothetical protein